MDESSTRDKRVVHPQVAIQVEVTDRMFQWFPAFSGFDVHSDRVRSLDTTWRQPDMRKRQPMRHTGLLNLLEHQLQILVALFHHLPELALRHLERRTGQSRIISFMSWLVK